LPPVFGAAANADPIAHLKTLSTDGSGHDVLAILANLLEGEPVRLKIGPDLENNAVFVWPAVSETDLKSAGPAERVAIFRAAPAPAASKILQTGRWTWYRIAIGADGSWLLFEKGE
jgi:hypothetical protein